MRFEIKNPNYDLSKSYTDLSKESLYKRKEATAPATLGDAVVVSKQDQKTKEGKSA